MKHVSNEFCDKIKQRLYIALRNVIAIANRGGIPVPNRTEVAEFKPTLSGSCSRMIIRIPPARRTE